jgi:hypothetical protein
LPLFLFQQGEGNPVSLTQIFTFMQSWAVHHRNNGTPVRCGAAGPVRHTKKLESASAVAWAFCCLFAISAFSLSSTRWNKNVFY